LFERNTSNDEVTKFRGITMVDPYKRKALAQKLPEEYIPINYVSPYSKKKYELEHQ
jgi:hypothetical protein